MSEVGVTYVQLHNRDRTFVMTEPLTQKFDHELAMASSDSDWLDVFVVAELEASADGLVLKRLVYDQEPAPWVDGVNPG